MILADQDPADLELIPLRRELRLSHAPALESGVPTWTVEDPIRNQFFRIGRQEMELLARWGKGNCAALIDRLRSETGMRATIEEVTALHQFLMQNSLLDPANPTVQAHLEQVVRRKKPSIFTRLLHHYIFFRVPLLKPDRFLVKTLPLVRPLGSKPALVLYVMTALLAFVLLAPQWSSFFSTLPYFFSLQGFAAYFGAIFFVKFLHELGHAYTSKNYGLRVPTIGVAFIVLWPMLYSDNSDAWRIKDRNTRLKIVAAGMITELVVASFATLAWVLLQPGLLKSVCFVLATSSWMQSLLINASPFMRFDGYYLLSDYLEVPNLAARAFALGRYRLRLALFGLDTGRPEPFSKRLERLLLGYCYSTWIYRVILFTGIALLVYHLFFKALGVFLFAAEIYIFLLKPIVAEIKIWWSLRGSFSWNWRLATSLSLMLLFLTAVVVPLPTRIIVPAVLVAQQTAMVFPPFDAQIETVHVHEGDFVARGDLIVSLASHELETQQQLLELQINALQAQINREKTSKTNIEASSVTANMLAEALSELDGYRHQQERLQVKSPISGSVNYLRQGIITGSWLASDDLLCLLVGQESVVIEGYIKEGDIQYLSTEPRGKFIADSGDLEPLGCEMTSLDQTAHRYLMAPELASTSGGDIAVQGGGKGELPVLAETRYLMQFSVDRASVPRRRIPGHVVMSGRKLPLAVRAWRSIAPGLVRENSL